MVKCALCRKEEARKKDEQREDPPETLGPVALSGICLVLTPPLFFRLNYRDLFAHECLECVAYEDNGGMRRRNTLAKTIDYLL